MTPDSEPNRPTTDATLEPSHARNQGPTRAETAPMSGIVLRNPNDRLPALAELYAPVADELAESERVFARELASRHAFVQELVRHVANFGGKRLRPALVLLSGKALGTLRRDHVVLAAVVEMIHTATLVHDDVLDESLVRRHAATVNAEWGNETAVLLGDYLFSHAYHLAASLDDVLACRWIGRATNLVCEGEMLQARHRGNTELDEQSYFEVVRGKTAELTAVACKLGAHRAGAPPHVVERLETYGRELGVAFQIADDVLDIWGEERAAGKSLGTDIETGKATLPLIHLLQTAPPRVAELARSILQAPDRDARNRLRPLLENNGSLEYAWKKANQSVQAANQALEILPTTPEKTTLQTLAAAIVKRET